MAASLLRVSALILLLVALWSAGNGEDLPHWTAMAWVLLAPAAAAWLVGLVGEGATLGWRGKLLCWLGAGYLVLVQGLLWLILVAPPLAQLPALAPAVRDLHGWDQAAQRALTLQASHAPDGQLWVRNWTEGSRLAWYSQQPVQVLSDKPSQFLLWWGAPEAPAILMRTAREMPAVHRLATPEGVTCEPIDQLDFQLQGVRLNLFIFYLCSPEADTPSQIQGSDE